MVAGHAVAALGGHGDAAKDVAAADHDADLDAHVARLLDVGRDAIDDRNVDAETLFTHERLAGGFEKDAAKGGFGRHGVLMVG